MPYFKKEIVASERPGLPLSIIISIEAHKRFSEPIFFTLGEMQSKLTEEGICHTQYGVAGHHDKGDIKFFTDSNTDPKDVKVHEEEHRWLYNVDNRIDGSFTEGWAYATTDYLCEDYSNAVRRHRFSLELGSFYECIVNKFLDGGPSKQDLNRMEETIDKLGGGYTNKNWAAFLNVFENFRYYAIFHDILRAFDYEEAKDIVSKGAKIIKKSGSLKQGLEYLTKFVEFHSVIVGPNRECSGYELEMARDCPENRVYIINTRPIWQSFKLDRETTPFSHKVLQLRDLDISVSTVGYNSNSILRIIEAHIDDFIQTSKHPQP